MRALRGARQACRPRRRNSITGKARTLMRKVFEKVLEAVRSPLHWWQSRGRVRSVQVEELPEALQKGRLYLIGSGAPWSAAMICPCGCGETIHLSLLHDDSPSWTLNSDRKGFPTLSPSVWRTKGC